MEEQLISFETAKLAKEKGFDWKCNYYYETSRQLICFGGSEHSYTSIDKTLWSNMYLLAPTQSLLQKWLREIHNIHICGEVRWNNFKKKELIYEFWIKDMREVKPSTKIHTEPSILSYEEALEKGLQEALKLINNI